MLISACTPSRNYNIRQHEASSLAGFTHSTIEYHLGENPQLGIDRILDPQDAVQTSQSLAATQYTPLPPGTSPGEAAVGSIIATMIIASSGNEASYNKAQSKIVNLNAVVNKLPLESELKKASSEAFEAFAAIPQKTGNVISGNKIKNLAVITIQPEIFLSNNLSKVKIKANILITDSSEKNTAYKNTFEYWSSPILPNSSDHQRESYWKNDNADAITQEIKTGLKEICRIFEADIENIRSESSAPKNKTRTIRYKDAIGPYFIRGQLISHDNDRFVVKDLRGNIKSIHGRLREKL
jgi:outer membrane murein-binding lipoprotein Lpp